MKNWDWTKHFETFLFDFDGLLVDTEELHFEAFRRLCLEEGCALDWDFAKYCQIAHRDDKALAETTYALFPKLKEKFPQWRDFYRGKKHIYLDLLSSAPLECFPGVPEFLHHLHSSHKKMAVATNSPLITIVKAQKRLPVLELIPIWITREDYERPKPYPDPYLKALEVLSATSKKAIGFEDTLRGLASLEAAGVKAVHVTPLGNGHFASFEGIDFSTS